MAHEIIIPLNSSNVPNLRRNFDFVCKSPENLQNAVVVGTFVCMYGVVPYWFRTYHFIPPSIYATIAKIFVKTYHINLEN